MSPARANSIRIRRRLTAGLVAALFLLVGGPGMVLAFERCPHHDRAPAAALAGSPDAPAAAPGHSAGHGVCTCIGACCSSAAASLPARAARAGAELLVPPPVAALPEPAPRQRPARVLSFHGYANPPPGAD